MTDLTYEQERLVRAYERAADNLKQSKSTNHGGEAAEAVFAQTYQALVREGLAPQIRRKYRGR